ncbi:Arf GTPase activating protein [Neocallimastix lanati (nom. inval.)]|uniref:Arf GTPase activating protein n=1 Tax=Neocallimastix californiae TaxID=1754190 RepID=A0A1Y2CB55_9FUNG|nr:Arf GTPase activating protein [Neocallimastix sp. JGI-2020a]ORY43565.1 Arf GTPase activating protein [Neocallimastix californiae]|eukprot:ORY43565.1 Arf GTPase activating protein [Neocallimastix californiae]
MISFKLKKQNERNERIIRDLMKLEENKKCFDCSSKVITYVNLSTNTFICTECGGLLREINHRVKNISLSTFTQEEIKGLQNGGNKKAETIWLAKWNSDFNEPNHNTYDIKSAKEYIKNKYIYKKWYCPLNKNENESKKSTLKISINSKSESNSKFNFSKSLNEIEFLKRRKSLTSQFSNGKSSPPHKSEIERNSSYNFQYYNPYILLDDEENSLFDYPTDDQKQFFDNYSNAEIDNNNKNIYNSMDNKISTDSVLIPNHNHHIYTKYNNSNNSISTEYTKYNFNNNNSSNNVYTNYNNLSNSNNTYTKYNNNSSTNPFLNNNININLKQSTSTNVNHSNSEKKQIFDDYPVYAPRSSSLLNKVLIDSVYHTNDTLSLDNKKIYSYKRKSRYSTRY